MSARGDVVAELITALGLAAASARNAAKAIADGQYGDGHLRLAAAHTVYAASIAKQFADGSRAGDTLPPAPPRFSLDDEVCP